MGSYVKLYEAITSLHTQGVGLTAGPCIAAFNDLYCILFCFNTSTVLHSEWSVLFYRGDSVVSWLHETVAQVTEAMASHSHRMYVPDSSFLGNFRIWDRLSIRFWKYVLLGDSALWVVLSFTITCFCLVSTIPWFFWQRVLVRVPLPVPSPVKNSQCVLMVSGCPVPDSFLGNSYWVVEVFQMALIVKYTNVTFPLSPWSQYFSYRALNNKRTWLELESMHVATKLSISLRVPLREDRQTQTNQHELSLFLASRCVSCIKRKLRDRQHN
jgi:hypothetical protein